ncbi:MAG TPA: DUF3048 domain-containing protein [Candidatus Saccharimonadales bacterium]|nr:DUF3048 domain-containing protein [Candidatus Saccharimonadales bacterium]
MNNKNLKIIGLLVYLAAAGISYFLFSGNSSVVGTLPGTSPVSLKPKGDNDYQAITFDPNAPKTEECPINGAMYGKDQKAWWEKHRPLGVMIENHSEARPQSGINSADVTYEAVAEGGITRTLNIFYCQDAGIVGPVRSARTYFLDFVSEYGDNPLYAHVGGANTPGPADALGQINDYGWGGYNDMNQFSIGFPTYYRDQTRLGHDAATEHTMYSVTNKLWDIGASRKLTNLDKDGKTWDTNFVKYTFKDDESAAKRPASQSINLEFWNDPDYFVDWIYSPKENIYLRKNGGVPHIDRDTKKQLSAHNIVVLFMSERHANDGYEGNAHLLYGTKGSGQALFFMDGKEIKGTWKKKDRESRTILTDNAGNEIKFNRGKIWFEIEALDATVTVK